MNACSEDAENYRTFIDLTLVDVINDIASSGYVYNPPYQLAKMQRNTIDDITIPKTPWD